MLSFYLTPTKVEQSNHEIQKENHVKKSLNKFVYVVYIAEKT